LLPLEFARLVLGIDPIEDVFLVLAFGLKADVSLRIPVAMDTVAFTAMFALKTLDVTLGRGKWFRSNFALKRMELI